METLGFTGATKPKLRRVNTLGVLLADVLRTPPPGAVLGLNLLRRMKWVKPYNIFAKNVPPG